MMGYTDRHGRYVLRRLFPDALLYTEMITARALYHGAPETLLEHHPAERPLALQLGGAEPELMARGAGYARQFGYCEVNINVGCPSDRVQAGRFGACLMREPERVADCVEAMREAGLPVTVKTRLGVDELDRYEDLLRFVDTVAAAGCRTFIIHARKAWLNGLDPKKNRSIPPLDHARVWRLKRDRPELQIVVNGGLRGVADCLAQLAHVDGVMIGRAACEAPTELIDIARVLFGRPPPALYDVVADALDYAAAEQRRGVPLRRVLRHLAALGRGRPGARRWRQALDQAAVGRQSLAALRSLAAELFPAA
ncbi:MAG: tRNA-dihydrouridine(20/20a) synthase [Gammaproteobacteria bacterium]|nr:MAG: tRNA-dihydrouridine(20/20a) synthase [Gammaproteobacteria bacterium]